MIKRIPFFFFLLIAFSFTQMIFAQNGRQSQNSRNLMDELAKGIDLYSAGRWDDAIVELRRSQLENYSSTLKAEAQFWIAIAELSAGRYYEAISDLDAIESMDGNNVRVQEVPYHKGRAFYYLGNYTNAIPLFRKYADSIPDSDYNKKAAAIYWIGECYYLLDDLSRAEEVFSTIVTSYTKSRKFEVSLNRLELIRQKKSEAELRELVKSSREEKKEQTPESDKSYEDAIIAYQNRIAPYLLKQVEKESAPPYPEKKGPDPGAIMRLLAIKTSALEMMDRLVSIINTYEVIETRRNE